jgi:iron complex outermembrane receptor protein
MRLQDRDGQLENAYLDNQKVDFKESQSFRGHLIYRPTDALSIDLRAQLSNQEGGSGYFMPGSEGVLPLPPPAEPIFFGNPTYEIQSNRIGESFVDFSEFSAKIDYEFNWGTLTSITSFTDVESGNDQDLDQTLVEAINIIVIDNSETLAQEFRLTSNADQALRWVAGVYFFDQDRFRSLATTFLGFPVPPAAQDLKRIPLRRGNTGGPDAGPQRDLHGAAAESEPCIQFPRGTSGLCNGWQRLPCRRLQQSVRGQ